MQPATGDAEGPEAEAELSPEEVAQAADVREAAAGASEPSDDDGVEYFVTRAVVDDREFAESYGIGGGQWLFTLDDTRHLGWRDFHAWLREIGVRPKDIEWTPSGGMDFSESSYAYVETRRKP